MQAKISAGTDCLRFLRVTGGNLPAPAGNSHEVFIVRVRADFFKPRDVSFYPVPNPLTKVGQQFTGTAAETTPPPFFPLLFFRLNAVNAFIPTEKRR